MGNVFRILCRESKKIPEAPLVAILALCAEKIPEWDLAIYFIDGYNGGVLSRRRVYLHAYHQRCGGRSAHERMNNYVQAHLQQDGM